MCNTNLKYKFSLFISIDRLVRIKKCVTVAHQKLPKLENDQNSKITQMKEDIERPERRRREGRRSVRFAFGRRSSLFCVPVLFLYLCLLWVYVFYGFYVGPAKLQRGATPPSVMVLLAFDVLLSAPPIYVPKYGPMKIHYKRLPQVKGHKLSFFF